jgi:hypothetical protein
MPLHIRELGGEVMVSTRVHTNRDGIVWRGNDE